MSNEYFDFEEFGPVWHLCTPGELSGIIFCDRDDYVFGMNLVALCAAEFERELKILTFQIMSNHLHFIIMCNEDVVSKFFNAFKKRLQRYFTGTGRLSGLNGFTHNAFRISDERYLQTVIVYVNRNGYLVDRNVTPFSYEWGANRFFFNRFAGNEVAVKICDIGIDAKRKMFKSRNFKVPDDFLVANGYVSPLSYCHIDIAESLFRDASSYFHLCSRQVETYSVIAKEIGDKVTYTDQEIYSAVVSLCIKRYNVNSPTLLGKDAKMDVAKIMHYDYNASNKQIKRLLRIDDAVMESLFPSRV